MSELPHCDQRVATPVAATFFCRHTKVRAVKNLVSAAICRECSYCTVACSDPRPTPVFEAAPPPRPVADRRRFPTLPRQLWNAAVSLARFVADGLQTVSREQYATRLSICDTCPERDGTGCRLCGCNLSLKARGRAFECPLGKWPAVSKR